MPGCFSTLGKEPTVARSLYMKSGDETITTGKIVRARTLGGLDLPEASPIFGFFSYISQ